MRGSPLVRSLILIALLALAGYGLRTLTQAGPRHPVAPPAAAADHRETRPSLPPIPFELVLSAPPTLVRILDPGGTVLFESTAPDTRQSASLPPTSAETIVLQVQWTPDASGHRFAKLTLEPPGQTTLRHVFDARGEIDDAWELPAGSFVPADD